MDDAVADITILLDAMERREPGAEERLLSEVGGELHDIARGLLAHRRDDAALEPTELVNEAYVRLFRGAPPSCENRRHFFFVVGRKMRDIIVEHYRRRANGPRLELQTEHLVAGPPEERVLDIDRGLRALHDHDTTAADVITLRFFAGLTIDQTAETLAITPARVRREWTYARAWLRRWMTRDGAADDSSSNS